MVNQPLILQIEALVIENIAFTPEEDSRLTVKALWLGGSILAREIEIPTVQAYEIWLTSWGLAGPPKRKRILP
jgi:hypothetical protein